jgi:hypothetical protein
MLIGMFAPGTLGPVDNLDLTGRGIGEEELHDSAPLVRALVVQRLELLWRNVEPHVDGSLSKPDPRFIEAGIRLLDRLNRLYRLDDPATGRDEVVGELVPTSQLVLGELEALEKRLRVD